MDERIAELRANGVALVAGSVTDLAGVTRAKYVPLRRLVDSLRSGVAIADAAAGKVDAEEVSRYAGW